MKSPALASSLAPLCAGLLLGAAATALLRHGALSSAPAVGPAAQSTDVSVSRAPVAAAPAPALVLPARLDAAEADAALAAYLALPPLADQAPASEIGPRLARLRALLTLLPDSSFERLFAVLATRVGGAEMKLRRAAFEVWTERDAPAAARWALAIVPGEAINAPARERYLVQAVAAWAETDFDAAYAWSAAVADRELADTLAGRLLNRLVATDPTRALALARERGEAFFKEKRLGLLDTWSKTDPASALQTLGAEFVRNDFHQWPTREAVRRWMEKSPRAAFDWLVARDAALAETSGSDRSVLQNISWLMGDKPETARAVADLLAARPDLPGQSDSLRQITYQWTQRDPAGALAWLKTIPDPERRAALIAANMQGTLKPEDFFAFAFELPKSDMRTGHIGNFVAGWALNDPDAALAWLDSHSSPELDAAASRVQGVLIAKLASSDPASALARWQALPPADRATSAEPFANAWAATDPAAALAWIKDQIQTDGAHSQVGMALLDSYRSAAARLALTDPEALLRLATEVQNPNLLTNAYYVLANDHVFVSETGPQPTPLPHARRAELLATIPDEKAREQSLTALLGNWLHSDYAPARAWLESHDAISPEAAAQLLERHDPATLSYY